MDGLEDLKSWLEFHEPLQSEIEKQLKRLTSMVSVTSNPIDLLEIKAAISMLEGALSIEPEPEVMVPTISNKEGKAAFPSSLGLIPASELLNINKKPVKANGSKAASPIKDKADIRLITRKLLGWGFTREALLVSIGCNVALRFSDLRMLRFDQVIEAANEDGTGYIKEIIEKKTSKVKRVTLNRTALTNIKLMYDWLTITKGVENPIYIFQSTSNNTKRSPRPISRSAINYALKYAQEELQLNFRLSSHSLRKSFGYHAFNNGNGTPIAVLRKLFNHASDDDTLRYVGIDSERVQSTYLEAEIEIVIELDL